MAAFLHAFICIVLHVILIPDVTPAINPVRNTLWTSPVSPEQAKWTARALQAIPSPETWYNVSEADIDVRCSIDLQLYIQGLTGGTMQDWAIKMFDASTKIPESLLSGAIIHLGNFDQCLDVIALDEGKFAYEGQYCGVNIALSPMGAQPGGVALPLKIATCVPDTCSPADIQEILDKKISFPLSLIGVQSTVTVKPLNCYNGNDREPLDAGAWVLISTFIVIGVLVFTGTAYDVNVQNKKENIVTGLLLPFSMIRNFRAVSNTEHAKGSITCLHGIRVMSILWIVLGHRYMNEAYFIPKINLIPTLMETTKCTMQIIVNGMPGVDTFFFMSGFLVCYIFLKDVTKGIKFNPIKYYVNRYFRLTTSFAIVMAYYTCLMRYTVYGPASRANNESVLENCEKSWWYSLLYVNNFIYEKMSSGSGMTGVHCLGQAWYLTADMQLAWLAPLLLIPLWRWPFYTSRLVLPILVLASCFAPFTSAYINGYAMTFNARKSPDADAYVMAKLHYPSYMRATPYLVGIMFAYFIIKNQETKLRLTKWMIACGWTLSTAFGLLVVFGAASAIQIDYKYDAVASAFYNGFYRLAWSLMLSWVVFVCHSGYGGPVDKILSWRLWLPISRLSYGIYLVHFIMIYYDTDTTKALSYFNHFSVLQKYCSDVIFSSIIALILFLGVEAPTLGLLNTFLRKKKSGKN